MNTSRSFIQTVAARRSRYALTKKSPIADTELQQLLSEIVTNVPSAFNSQSSRLVVLLHAEHDKFWEMVKTVLKVQIPQDKFEQTEKKLSSFGAAYGTVSLKLAFQ